MKNRIFLVTQLAILIIVTMILGCSSEKTYNEEITAKAYAGEQSDVIVYLISSDYPHYENLGELVTLSTDIVIATILNERVEWLNAWVGDIPEEIDPYEIFTIYQIEIHEVFQGSNEVGQIVEVTQLGGKMECTHFINEDRAPLYIGDNLLLFLRAPYTDDFPFVLMNPSQSAYRLNDAREEDGMMNVDEVLEGVHPYSDLFFTISDLITLLDTCWQDY